MNAHAYAPGTILDEVPLFPLPQVVFFPQTMLPLHVFEPRYRLMTERALAGDKRLAVVLVTQPRRVDQHGHPPIAEVATVGEIVRHQKLSDGRYDIVLEGKARVLLQELPFHPPYRRARGIVLGPTDTHVSDNDIAALVSAATRFTARVGGGGRSDLALPPTYQPGLLADACASSLVIEPSERQRVLETLDIAARVRLCCELLAVQDALLVRHSAVH